MQKEMQDLLGIETNLIVKGTKMQGEKAIVHLEWRKIEGICPQCGDRVRDLHQDHGRRKLLHEIGSDGKRVYLDIPNLRCRCRFCGKIFPLRSQGTFPWSRVTAHMLVSIFDRLRRLSFKQVAEWTGMNHRTLRNYAKRFLKKELNWEVFRNQEKIRLGLDEHSISGKRKMALLIVELVSSTPVAVLESHKKEELVRFLEKVPSWVKERMDEMVIDLQAGYRNAIQEALPSHVKIVADPFHVVRDANKRLDEERRVSEEVYFAMKGVRRRIPKRILMKAEERLHLFQKAKVKKILSENENLEVFYRFKERVRGVYKSIDYQEAEERLNTIIEDMASYRRWPALKRWQRSLEAWKDEILNHFISRSSNGKVEGYNVVIKLLKRISFGIRDTELYAKKIMLGLVPIKLLPQFLT